MKFKGNKFSIALLLILAGLAVSGGYAGPAPNRAVLAQKAEQEGKFAAAFQHYLALFQGVNGNMEEETRLRKKVMAMAGKLEVPPAVPEPAHVRLQRGQRAIDDSPRASDYRNAAREFSQAIQLAPWWADPYYELGVVHETLGEYRAAIVNFRYCILADPDSRRSRKLHSKIVDLLDKDDRPASEKIEEVSRRQVQETEREREFIKSLNGTWRQMYNGPTCLWKLDVGADGEFELLPALVRDSTGQERALSKADRGYFIGDIVGDAVHGYAVSSRAGQAQKPRETVKLNGTFQPRERMLVLRYTFFFDASGTPISSPSETELRFKQVRN